MEQEQIQKIIHAKRQQRSPLELAAATELHSQFKFHPILKHQPVAPSDPKELEPALGQLESELTTPLEQHLELDWQMSTPESVHSESLAKDDWRGSLFGSGWEYGQLLKEFRL